MLAFRQGDYAAARSCLHKCLAIVQNLGDRPAIATTLRSLGRMAIDRGEYATAGLRLEESLAIGRELDDRHGIASSLNYLGFLAFFRHDYAAARSRLEESLVMLRELGDQWGTVVSSFYLARAAYDQDDYAAARSGFAASLETCRVLRFQWIVPYLLEAFAGLAAAQRQPVRAVRLAGAAAALHDALGAPLPAFWRAEGQRRLEPARRALSAEASAAAWAEGQAMTMEQAIAYALATEDSAPPPAPPPQAVPLGGQAAPLTPREREIAALIGRGLTNRQIAAELVISERTGDTHVGNILSKLGFASRARVAAWAVEQGLLTPRPD